MPGFNVMSTGPLHPLENRLLRHLVGKEDQTPELVAKSTKMKPDQVRRAAEWLKTKGFVESKVRLLREIQLGPEGVKAARRGLPERRLVRLVSDKGGSMSLGDLRKSFASPTELNPALGYARRRSWLQFSQIGTGPVVEVSNIPRPTTEETLLERMQSHSVEKENLTESENRALGELSTRPGYIVEVEHKEVLLRLTPAGKKASSKLGSTNELDAITPSLLASKAWRKRPLRAIDVEAPAPAVHLGKKHPVQRFLDEVREIFMSLGFEEIEGPTVQPCFWNFDALFIPQDHPARDMQDTFYLSGLQASQVADRRIVREVARVHHDGGNTGSMGWGYDWDENGGRRIVLRTHTTAVTIRYLAENVLEEGRVFSIGKVFRNEKVTYKNLVEFHQIEGIAFGPKVSLRDMMGLLSQFYSRLGLDKVKFWPSFFPYTEPSLQSMVYFEKMNKWVELCGMGIFRPEVTLPLGIKNPVLAWGGGLERLVMLRYGVDDIRQLYQNNLGWLRSLPVCL